MDEPSAALESRRRRAMIGALGTAAVASVTGCLGSVGDDRSPAAGSTVRTLVNERVRVDPGSYETASFSLSGEQWVAVSANLTDESLDVKRDSPGVDVLVVDPDAFSAFRHNEAFDYVGGVSMPGVTNGEVAGTVAAGSYELVVDNSDRSRSGAGDADVVVDLDVTARDERPSGGG